MIAAGVMDTESGEGNGDGGSSAEGVRRRLSPAETVRSRLSPAAAAAAAAFPPDIFQVGPGSLLPRHHACHIM